MKKITKIKRVAFFLSTLLFALTIPFGALAQDEETPPAEDPPEVEVSPDAEPEVLPDSEEADSEAVEDAGSVADAPQPELISEISEETETAPTEAVDEDFSTLMIHVEQLGWNSFRLRPSFRLGVSEAEYLWAFGDGTNSSERFVEHQYERPGIFMVELGVIDENGTPHSATIQVGVGFFHLANWRMWVLIGLLALIIIVAAVIAGVTGSIVPKSQAKKKLKKPKPSQGSLEGSPLASLSEESGDLDVLASTGLEAGDLSDELALLEALDDAPVVPKPIPAVPKPIPAAKTKPVKKAAKKAVAKAKAAKLNVEPISVPVKKAAKPKAKPKAKRGIANKDLTAEELRATLQAIGGAKKPAKAKKPVKKASTKTAASKKSKK